MRIRLTEAQLHRVIKESVRKIMNEKLLSDYDFEQELDKDGNSDNIIKFHGDTEDEFNEGGVMSFEGYAILII
jgi:hypothetical protein